MEYFGYLKLSLLLKGYLNIMYIQLKSLFSYTSIKLDKCMQSYILSFSQWQNQGGNVLGEGRGKLQLECNI